MKTKPAKTSARVDRPATPQRAAKPRASRSQSSAADVSQPSFPEKLLAVARKHRVALPRHILCVSVREQAMVLFEQNARSLTDSPADYKLRRRYVISTSRFGIGQVMNSNRTPLGLHRVARKIGGSQPLGTVFKARKPVGNVNDTMPEGGIVHRILWLEGLEPGHNRGGNVDTFQRYIYIHGFWDEATLGRPQSHGCIHVGAADLLPLYLRVPVGTLVWIARWF